MKANEYLNELVSFGGVPVRRGELEKELDRLGVTGPARLRYGRLPALQVRTIEGARVLYDEKGREIVDLVTCGTCGETWNDAAVSQWTPTPSARCPFENEHGGHND